MVRSVLRDPVKLNPGFGVRWVVFESACRCPFLKGEEGNLGLGISVMVVMLSINKNAINKREILSIDFREICWIEWFRVQHFFLVLATRDVRSVLTPP